MTSPWLEREEKSGSYGENNKVCQMGGHRSEVERLRSKGASQNYLSLAPPLELLLSIGALGQPLVQPEEPDLDQLGREARADFYQLVEERSKAANRWHVIKRF